MRLLFTAGAKLGHAGPMPAVDPYASLARQFPCAYAYLLGLPQGLASFPDCQVMADGPLALRGMHPDLWEHPDIPPLVRQFLMAPWRAKTWVPMVAAVLQHQVLQDQLRLNDPEYVKVAVRQALLFLERPAYRAVWRVLSPHLLLMGFQWRWRQFHRGMPLVSLGGNGSGHTLRMGSPPRLLAPVTSLFYARLFATLLEATGATHVRVESKAVEPGVTDYMARWGAEVNSPKPNTP